jgi:chorismate synthase
VIGEAMVALIVAGAFIDKFGGDSIREIRRNLEGFLSDSGRWFELAETSNR